MPRIIQRQITRIQIVSVEITWNNNDENPEPVPMDADLELFARDPDPVPVRKPRRKPHGTKKQSNHEADE